MKLEGVNAITIGIWAVVLAGLFFLFGFGPFFFGGMLVVGLIWRFVDKKKKGGAAIPSSPMSPPNPGM
ncbi:MAG: hypothetical protein COU47_02540 [Candidatus Niyogibacteria bacterium CG10_big_fil_rev_8_21_14_0_10_46_36]|uniref:Uncharacterized protein n=1 Tax=Candidatus Niyogibacteria bacterium CG10_big_fil_rev_8_21_14_0_10_46_36 TaxID=1974726 RepID=A0A2H0TDJ1_9BACT|nr:MAG: hypothetical protein COU47_02540 [Candidatus Niyogibacteria bacterium CG10_big_fil_rev_8_21_14_0_10_46_36]